MVHGYIEKIEKWIMQVRISDETNELIEELSKLTGIKGKGDIVNYAIRELKESILLRRGAGKTVKKPTKEVVPEPIIIEESEVEVEVVSDLEEVSTDDYLENYIRSRDPKRK